MPGGTSRIGNYDVIESIGAGTVGIVYRAKQLTMDRFVALKVLKPKYAQDPEFVKKFIAEARTAGKVSNANVCQVYEVGQDKGHYYFSMELVDGPSLEQRFKTAGRLDVETALEYMRQATQALQAAHRNGLVHRDVKPANLLVSSSTGTIKLVDLGLARDASRSVDQMELGLAGTPYYMAPEQGQGLPVDIRSDIYALGATFYHLLVGRPPFIGPHATAVLMKHAGEPLVPPCEVQPGIPKRVSAIIERMLAKAPADRYETPDDLLQAIDLARSGKPPAAERPAAASARKRPPTAASLPARPVRQRERAVTVLTATVAGGVLMLVLMVVVFVLSRDDPRIEAADRALERVQQLVALDTVKSLTEASSAAREVVRTAPASAEGRERAKDAARRVSEVEARILNLIADEIRKRTADLQGGAEDFAALAARISQFEGRYTDSSIPAGFRDQANALFARARDEIAGAHGRAAAAPGRREGALDEIERQIDDLVAAGLFAEAVDIIAVVIEASDDAGDARRAREIRAEVEKAASTAFAELAGEVSAGLERRRFEHVRSRLKQAQRAYAFEPFAGRLENLVTAVDLATEAPVVAPADEAAARAKVESVITDVVRLIQRGDRAGARDLIENLRATCGTSTAYRSRKAEIDILAGLAER